MSDLKLVMDKLDIIENKLGDIDRKLEEIDKKLVKCEDSCRGMDSHINFVEETYEVLKSPLNFLKTQVSFITGSGDSKMLKDK